MYQSFIKPAFIDAKNFVLDTLFPINCLACGEEGQFICDECKSVLKQLEHQRCIVCQKPTPFGATHPHCQTPLGADALISFYDYHDKKVAEILIKGKYNFLPEVYRILGTMISKKLSINYPLLSANFCLTPVPLHSFRQRWRGFNQAEVLCQTLAKDLNLAIDDALVRTKITKTQKDLKKDKRKENILGAFALKKSTNITGQNILLVDDVTTTGATLQQAAQVLKRSGAAKVICLTVARD